MTDQAQRKLRIVPYDPNDYALGEALGKEHGTTSNDPNFISSALSLYFQWEDHRSCVIYPESPKKAVPIPCIMDYDRDERSPSEIRILFPVKQSKGQFREFQKVTLRFEVFRTCYEVRADLIALNSDSSDDSWNLIITPPSEILVYKNRRLPRILVSKEQLETFPRVTWSQINTENKVDLKVIELGLMSIKAVCTEMVSTEIGTLNIGEKSYSAQLVRRDGEVVVLTINHNNWSTFGDFFDFYRKYAYPSLRSRYEQNLELAFKLYIDTNYFGKYTGGISDVKQVDTLATWKTIKSGFHESTADYYIADDDNNLTGASSASLAFYNESGPIWIFHQLCALKRPDQIRRSCEMYAWRAEYLAGRPEFLTCGVWYDAKSRWIERIYTKFAKQCNSSTRLYPIHLHKCTFDNNSDFRPVETIRYKIGAAERTAIWDGNSFGAIMPLHLNAGETLDAVVFLNSDTSLEQISRFVAAMGNTVDQKNITLSVTTLATCDISALNGTPVVESGRFCHFEKSDLVSFLASLEHSVAITERKYANG